MVDKGGRRRRGEVVYSSKIRNTFLLIYFFFVSVTINKYLEVPIKKSNINIKILIKINSLIFNVK